MLYINFNLNNTWSDRFRNLGCCVFTTPWSNKFIEIEAYKDNNVVSINLNWTIRCDHAGLDIELGLFGYAVHFNFYDNRHWDYKNNCWENSNA